ncbi:MAG: hypothetical protein AAGU11_18370 [Syntrophobacteraceae bacterium]
MFRRPAKIGIETAGRLCAGFPATKAGYDSMAHLAPCAAKTGLSDELGLLAIDGPWI